MHFVSIKRVSRENLERLQREIDQVLDQDLKATGLLSVPNLDRRQGRCCGQNWGSRALHVLRKMVSVDVHLIQPAGRPHPNS